MAYRAFKTARAGLQVDRSTAGTPTRILQMSEGNHEQTVETIRPTSLRGSYFGFYSAQQGNERNEVRIAGDLDYSMAAWLGQVYGGSAAPSGASADKTYAYTPSGTADTLRLATIEFGFGDGLGASVPAWKIPNLGGEELTLAFSKTDGRVSYDARLVSASTATQISAWSGSPTMPAVQLVQAINTQVYFDTSTIGSTADNYFTEVEWSLQNGFVALQTLNNSAASVGIFRPDVRKWTARLKRYYINDTLRDLYVAKTPVKVRVKALGPTLGASNYSVQLDLYGVLTSVSWTDVDGLGVEEYQLEPYYDTTATSDFVYTVVAADTSIT